MSSIYVGGTIKITGAERHPATDDLLIDNVDLSDSWIVDIGASDGSTSLDLVNKIKRFRRYTIADLYLTLDSVSLGKRTVYFDADGEAILVAGPRVAAWPSLSRVVRAGYGPLLRRARSSRDAAATVLLLNPQVRRLLEQDPRVDYRVHDVFTPWTDEKPDVIKVANLLRRLYFSDDQLLRALHAIRDSLPDGGFLLIVDNPRAVDPTPAAGLYRRSGGGFVEVDRVGHPEIDDLVRRVGAPG